MAGLSWLVPVIIGRVQRAQDPRPRLEGASATVQNEHGWWTTKRGFWWLHDAHTDTWTRKNPTSVPQQYGQQDTLVWNIESWQANDILAWIQSDGVYEVVTTNPYKAGDPIWATNNRIVLHLRRVR